MSEGFWTLAFGETAIAANTKNRTYYVHGHTANGVSWGNGEGPWNVRGSSYTFGKTQINDGRAFGVIEHTFSCD